MPKANELYAALTASEKKQFAERIKLHKRQSLQLIFKYIAKEKSKDWEFSKEKAFVQIFTRPYSAGEDYLLRNELRLLVSEIYDFLMEVEIRTEREKDESFGNTMVLRGLLQRKCFEEVEQLFPKYFAAALSRLNFEQARRQADIYFRYLVFNKEISVDTLEQARSLMLDQIQHLKLLYRTGFVLNQNNRAMCEAMLAMHHKPVAHRLEFEIDTDFSTAETPFIQFLTFILLTYSEPSIPKRIELVEQAVESITKVQKIYPEWKFPALGTLGTLHYVNENFTVAQGIFEEALRYSREVQSVQSNNIVDVLHNYTGTLMRLGQYEKAIAVMDEYDEIIKNHNKLALRFAGFRCFCNIFLRRPVEAFAAIPLESMHNREYEHLYFRFIYAIIPYLNGDAETAHRESVNLQDYFDRHKDTLLFAEQRTAALFLRRFFGILLLSPDKIKHKLQMLHAEIEEFAEQNKQISTLFLMVWLRSELRVKAG
ncbi:MAG: hypothetical protein IPM69_06785 [Ignavibacteria bacterium]|nr:hypothetical protein [Ignavibacteria bacterium]